MALPLIPLKSDSITLDGVVVEFHALSRQQRIDMNGVIKKQGAPAADPYVIACATDTAIPEATAWLNGISISNSILLLTAICTLSDMIPPAGEGGPKENRKTRRANTKKSSSATSATPSTTS